MNHYRLLRDNKESGPYSKDELIVKGFKPYDLIWLEGKSAGWRYPSEIEELKKYSPIVEEQPFDRFFRKPLHHNKNAAIDETTVNNIAAENIAPAPQVKHVEKSEPEPVLDNQPPAVIGNIHIILPSGNKMNVDNVSKAKNDAPLQEKKFDTNETKKSSSFAESIAQPYNKTPNTNNKKPYGYTKEIEKKSKENSNATNTKITDKDNKKNTITAVASPENDQYNKAKSSSVIRLAAIFIGTAVLIGLGVMIGLTINKSKSESIAAIIPSSIEQKNTASSKSDAVTNNPVSSPTVNDSSAVIIDEKALSSDVSLKPETNLVPTEENKPSSTNTAAKNTETSNSSNKEQNKLTNISKDDINNLTNQENSSTKKTMAISAASLEKQLNITANHYKVGAFGGITDLKFTLINDSKLAFDIVEVEVDYVQANNKVYKTERIAFRDVAAGKHISLNAPKSTRGVKVSSRIKVVRINAKESASSNLLKS